MSAVLAGIRARWRLTLERSVSAGWEMIADATPAMTPEARDTVNFQLLAEVLGEVPVLT